MNELVEQLRLEFKDEECAYTYVDEFLNAAIATQIKVIREQRGLSQEQLAEKTGMKQERISVLEDVNYGSWSVTTLKRIARALGVTLKVSFETFGSIIDDIANFSRNSLERESRKEELCGEHQRNVTSSTVLVDLMEGAKNRNKQPKNQESGQLSKYAPNSSQSPTSIELETISPPVLAAAGGKR